MKNLIYATLYIKNLMVVVMFKRIRNLREDHDIKQSDIAKRLHITQPQYQLYESGKRQIPVDILIKLSDIYDVSVDYLIERTNSKKPYPPTMEAASKRFLTYFSRLNQENKDYILGEMVKLHREQEERSNEQSKKDIG